MRIILAGVAGGLILFIWGAISHMVLPLGEVGIKAMPNEAQVTAAMKANINEPGLYFYPWLEDGHAATEAEQAAWTERYRSGPNGILVYHPTGGDPMPPSMLLTEVGSNILACLLAAFIISLTGLSFIGRMATAAVFGLVAWLSIDVSYWNWYGFPTDYIMAQAADQVIGWLLAGIGIAALIRGRMA